MKKLLRTLGAIMLTVALCVCTLGVSQAVKAEKFVDLDIEGYQIRLFMTDTGEPTSPLLTGYSGNDTVLKLPTHFIYNKMEIQFLGIEKDAFKDNTKITKLIIPEGYEFLSSGIVDGCTKLRTVVVGNSVSYIPEGVFGNKTVIRGTEEANYKKVIGKNSGGGGNTPSNKKPFEKGADFAAADKVISKYSSEVDPAGSVFGLLQLKQKKVKKNAIKVSWKKVAGAKKYAYYATSCGKKNKYVRHGISTGTSFNYKKICGKKLKKGSYYKFIVIAIDKNNKVVTTSKTVHVATKGGKVTNDKGVKTKAKKNKVKIKVKKTFKLKAKEKKPKKGKVKRHRKIKYESLNSKVATVSAKGVIKGIKKGSTSVFAYAQNGVCAKVKVTVK